MMIFVPYPTNRVARIVNFLNVWYGRLTKYYNCITTIVDQLIQIYGYFFDVMTRL